MSRIISLSLLAVMLVGASNVRGQLSPDEAAKRLAEKQKQRDAERSQKVMITRGELDDLRAEVVKLRAEVMQLKKVGAAAAPKPAGVRVPAKIEVGLTHDEVVAFVKAHATQYEIVRDEATGSSHMVKETRVGQGDGVPAISQTVETVTRGDAAQVMEIIVKGKVKVKAGSHSNGATDVQDFKMMMVPVKRLHLKLADGAVASVSETREGKPYDIDDLN